MPKQTIGYLREVALMGVSHGCITDLSLEDKQTVLNDLRYVQSLRQRAQNICSTLNKKKALFIKLSKTKTKEEKDKINSEIAATISEFAPGQSTDSAYDCITFIRGATERALYLRAFTHCTSTRQEESIDFDKKFVDDFLDKCSTVYESLWKLDDLADRKVKVISFNKLRDLIKNIQESIVINGVNSCFYSDLERVAISDDTSLEHDVEFLGYLWNTYREIKYMLNQDKSALEKTFKVDDKLKVDTSELSAFKEFRFQRNTFKPTSDKEDQRLQMCHQLVINGLFYSSSAHLITLFDRISQMRLIDSALDFLEKFKEHCLIPKSSIRNKQDELLKKEQEKLIKEALEEQARKEKEKEKEDAYDRGYCMYLDAQDEIKGANLKRKGTESMYSLAEVLRPPQFHCGRSSLTAVDIVREMKPFPGVVEETIVVSDDEEKEEERDSEDDAAYASKTDDNNDSEEYPESESNGEDERE